MLLRNVLDTIRTGTNGQVCSLLNLIRSNAPDEDLCAYTDGCSTLSTDSEQARHLDSLAPDVAQPESQWKSSRRSTHRVQDLLNPPIIVPAQPWTTVTSDDDLVSHLISMWFTWSDWTFAYVDRDLFVKDMAAGSLKCEYCSPLLVNAMLAQACVRTSMR